MSYKYTLKDVLLEAGVREYESTPKDMTWTPSEKHKTEMESLYNKKAPLFSRVDFFAASKALAAVAAVAVVAVLVLAIKPLREPLFFMLGINKISTDTEITDITDTEPDADKQPAAVTEAVTETTAKQTEAVTSTVTETSVEVVEETTKYRNEIEKYLYLKFSDPDAVKTVNRIKAIEELEYTCQLEDYVVYAARLLKNRNRDELLMNCAGMLIYSLAENDDGIYMYNSSCFGYANKKTEDEPKDTYFIRWYDNYIFYLSDAAKDITKEMAQSTYELFYKVLNIAGFNEWNSQNSPREAVEDSLKSLFEVYNSVYAGIPMGNTDAERLTKPYEPELAGKIKSFWGDEEREFVKSSVTLTEYKKKLKNSIQAYTDLYIDDTKYFITVGDTVYLTTAKETDTDADRYYFVEIMKINKPNATMRTIYGTAKVIHNGAEEIFYYDFADAYHQIFSKCDKGTFGLSDKVIVYRGEKSVVYAIESITSTSSLPTIAYTCCRDLSETTVKYVASHYFKETDEKTRAALSTLLQQCVRLGKFTFFDLLGRENVKEFCYAKDGMYIFNGNYVKEQSVWTEKFAAAVKDAVKNKYREEITDYYPAIYTFLSEIGFDGYKAGEPDTAFRSRRVISEAMDLANAVLCGVGKYDDTSVAYGDKELGNLEYPEAVAEIIEGNGIEYWEGIRTQAQGFKTADEWKQYYKKILPENVVEGAIRNTGRFIIADGLVYTSHYGGESTYETDILSVRKTGEKNGRVVLAVDVQIPLGMSYYTQEVSFEVVEENGEIRIVGGTFIDIFLKDGITEGKAALTVYELLRAQEMLYDGNMNFNGFQGYEDKPRVIQNKEELEEYIKSQYSDEPLPEVPDEMYPLYVYVGWSSISSWKWALEKMLPDGYYDILITNNENAYPMVYRYLLLSANVKSKTTPVIGSADNITVTDIYENMTVLEQTDEKITVSLDFIKEENGNKENKTYTFTFENGKDKLYLMLTGGTFDSEVIRR